MINIARADNKINHYLIKTIDNYNLKGKEIAQTTGITEALISNYINNTRKPSKKNREKLWEYLYNIWQSGVIKLPVSEYWSLPFYIPVMDIKNPFETWRDSCYHGSTPEEFEQWMKDWETNKEYQIVAQYQSYEDFKRYWHLDGIRYNAICERINEGSMFSYTPQDYIEDYNIIEQMEEGLI